MFSARLNRFTRSAGFRLTLLYSALFAVMGIFILGMAYTLMSDAAQDWDREQVDYRLHQLAEAYRMKGVDRVRELCAPRLASRQRALFVRVADADNTTLFLRDAEEWADFPPAQLAHQSNPLTGGGRIWLSAKSENEEVLEVASIRFADGNVLQVGKTTENTRVLLNKFRNSALIIFGLLLPSVLIIGAFFAFRTLRPVRQLTDAVDRILRTGDFSARVPTRRTGSELDELVKLFNELLKKIAILIQSMRESLDNVAHDLRTPMTRMRAVAHGILERDAGYDETRDALADCVEESERVLIMLNTLMDISEAESGIIRLTMERLGITTIVEDAMDLYREVAEENEIRLSANIPIPLTVQGDPLMLRRVLANLIDNAIKYSQPGGAVVVAAERDVEGVVISVQDGGVGIPEQELPRIWDRLYRVDKSRSARGLGLGLSFVKAIVEAHAGTVTAVSKLGEGSTFVIHLPSRGIDLPDLPDGRRTVAEQTL